MGYAPGWEYPNPFINKKAITVSVVKPREQSTKFDRLMSAHMLIVYI